ncbi:putative ec39 protein [Diaporthe ampelina]|uniref:Putative ec39 protein n=1 Tax=Diaporthe ampelina TaxID=1214573 RepID=A0A0G2I3A2_9PEZI|nr:putative ec39 protein [Diaporthe ampelina]
MHFLNAILVFASLASAAVVAIPIEARAPPSPCYSNQVLTWNTGQIPGSGGWICYDTPDGECTEYSWKTDLPYYSCT